MQDEPPEEPADKVRWIDTDVMIADPLAKLMESDWDIQQPHHSIWIKRAKQLKRRKTEHTGIDNQQEVSPAENYTGEINLIDLD